MTSKELREQRARVAEDIKKMSALANDEKREWTGEDEQRWTKVNEDYDALSKRIEIAERAEAVGEEQEAPVDRLPREQNVRAERREDPRDAMPTREDRAMALQGWALVQNGKPECVRDEHSSAAQRCGVNLSSREYVCRLDRDYDRIRREVRAMNTTATTGGDVIPSGFVNQLERALLAYNGVRRAGATVIRTDSGNTLSYPTMNDTSNAGQLLGEATEETNDTTPATSAVSLGAYKFSSKMIKVSSELLQDSAFNLESVLAGEIGRRLGSITNTYFTTGSGNSQPNGIVTASTAGKTAATTDTMDPDEILDLIYSVDEAYRDNAAFMMHSNIVLALRKLRDGDGRSIWNQGMTFGEPDRLYGYPIFTSTAMASSVTASAKVALFGDVSKYLIREAGEIRIVRADQRYVEFDQVMFIGFMRADGDLLDAGTHPVKHLVMAAQ